MTCELLVRVSGTETCLTVHLCVQPLCTASPPPRTQPTFFFPLPSLAGVGTRLVAGVGTRLAGVGTRLAGVGTRLAGVGTRLEAGVGTRHVDKAIQILAVQNSS